jgi:hypothetical protein
LNHPANPFYFGYFWDTFLLYNQENMDHDPSILLFLHSRDDRCAPLHPVFIGWDRVSWTFQLGCLWTGILLVSGSWETKINRREPLYLSINMTSLVKSLPSRHHLEDSPFISKDLSSVWNELLPYSQCPSIKNPVGKLHDSKSQGCGYKLVRAPQGESLGSS